jgi:hypothetical protein
MPAGQPEGNIKGGDQPRMTERQLSKEQSGMGRISYTRQAQRGPMPRGGYGRSSNKR